MIKTKITENFSTIPKLSDYGIGNCSFSGQQLMEYMNAVGRWASVFGFQMTELLRELEPLSKNTASYYQGQYDLLKEILGVSVCVEGKCPVCEFDLIVEPDGVKRCYCCGTAIGKPSVCVEGKEQ